MENLFTTPAVSYEDTVRVLYTAGYEGLLLPAYIPGTTYMRDGVEQTADGKHTFALGVTGKRARPITSEDIKAWVGRERGRRTLFNTLIKCGPIPGRPGFELAFLDVDGAAGHASDVDGVESLAAFAERRGLTPLPLDTLVRNTNRPADSREGHYGFIVPSGRTWSTPAGVDFIGAGIRTIVAPGGLHKSGRRYRSYRGDTPCGWPRITEWPDMPAEWVEALSRPEGERRSGVSGEWRPSTVQEGQCAIVRLTVRRYAQDPRDGRSSRHEGMVATMAHLAYLAAEGHVGADAAAREIVDAFVAVTGDESRRAEAERAARDAWADHGGSSAVDPCIEYVKRKREERVFGLFGLGDAPKPAMEPKPAVSPVSAFAWAEPESAVTPEPHGIPEEVVDAWGYRGAYIVKDGYACDFTDATWAIIDSWLDLLEEARGRQAKNIGAEVALLLSGDSGDGWRRIPRGWREYLLGRGEVPPERELSRWHLDGEDWVRAA